VLALRPVSDANSLALRPLSLQRATRFAQTAHASFAMPYQIARLPDVPTRLVERIRRVKEPG